MSLKRRWCTVPEIFGFRKWFEKRFGCDCCMIHDEYYKDIWRAARDKEKAPIKGLEADNIFFKCMMRKGKKYLPIAVLSWVYLRVAYWPLKLIHKLITLKIFKKGELSVMFRIMTRG